LNTEILYTYFQNSTGICTDTRKIFSGCLFFALKGPNFNGNSYALQALEQGALFAIIDEEISPNHPQLLKVDDVLGSLQDLANLHRKKLTIPVIGIAGSNGKTTTKELTYAVLSQKFKTFATVGNLNNHIGVPLSILAIKKGIEIVILELGANHEKELAFLCKIAEPSFGIITNNGLDHLEGYGGIEGVIRGNSEIFSHLKNHKGTIFVNSKDEVLRNLTKDYGKTVFFGNTNDYFTSEIKNDTFFLEIETYNKIDFQTQLIGAYNLDNINAALCMGKYFGVDDQDAANAIAQYIPANNRSQLVKTDKNQVILDCYNANPSSMQKSIESFSKIKSENKVLMLGDMFELGEHSEKEHLALIYLVESLGFTNVFFCGTAFLKVFSITNNSQFLFFETRLELENYLSENKIADTSILIKGSRGMTMEELVKFL
jgi:UDP-N-acetylmuramoyl-tripeptide--D-alanyl-D-alanine ligase